MWSVSCCESGDECGVSHVTGVVDCGVCHVVTGI